jgi:hypothetical protein
MRSSYGALPIDKMNVIVWGIAHTIQKPGNCWNRQHREKHMNEKIGGFVADLLEFAEIRTEVREMMNGSEMAMRQVMLEMIQELPAEVGVYLAGFVEELPRRLIRAQKPFYEALSTMSQIGGNIRPEAEAAVHEQTGESVLPFLQPRGRS